MEQWENIKEVEFEGARTAGIFVDTTLEKAPRDSQALWETFVALGEKYLKLPADNYGIMYGITLIKSETDITYLASAPVTPEQKIPVSMKEIEIPAGLYIALTVPSIEKTQDAYKFVFKKWLPEQTKYSFDTNRTPFERYGDHPVAGAFDLYVPIVKTV